MTRKDSGHHIKPKHMAFKMDKGKLSTNDKKHMCVFKLHFKKLNRLVFVTSFSYFSHVPEVRKILSEPLFDVEFADKKNCIFSFFVFSKFVEQ